MPVSPGWVENDTADNAAATAAKAAPTDTNKTYVVYGVSASFSDTTVADKLLQIKDGSTVIWQDYVPAGGLERTFPAGLTISKGIACSALLAASGTGGKTGSVNLHGNQQ